MKKRSVVLKLITAFYCLISLFSLYIFGILLSHSLFGGNPPEWMQKRYSPDADLVYIMFTLCRVEMSIIFGYYLFRSRSN